MNNETRRAWSESPNRILLRLGSRGDQLDSIDVRVAEQLAHDLSLAIEEARSTPFSRWWNSLPIGKWPEYRKVFVDSVEMDRVEAEKFFNQIRNAS